jgi:nicotinamide-nucleotide amidase
MMNVEIISVGDELLIGQTVNTNASWMGEQLLAIGVHVQWVTTVGDSRRALIQSLEIAESRGDVVLMTGGLGPTHDDITKKVACDYFGASLVMNEDILEQVRERFRRRGLKMVSINEGQALVPDSAEIMRNEQGTAPGMIFKRDGFSCYIMPGVPREMKGMMQNVVLPQLQRQLGGRTIKIKNLMTTGIPESTLFEQLDNLDEIQTNARVAFLPGLFGVKIRLMAIAESEEKADRRIIAAEALVRKKVAVSIFADQDISLEQAVANVLIEYNETVAVAESCTGGLVANLLTNISGSSTFFDRGIVTYSNTAKIEHLNVASTTIEKFGAVSKETAKAMAEGIRHLSKTDYGISITGIAGPSGGTDEKPVGLVFVACSDKTETVYEQHLFANDRLGNKQRSAQAILNLLRKQILKNNKH